MWTGNAGQLKHLGVGKSPRFAYPQQFMKHCEQCGSDSGKYALCDNCHSIWQSQTVSIPPYFKEMGVENPIDTKGSTAHVRDIKSRRYDAKTEETYRYKPPVRYFY